jgi:hypothetical protein
MDDWAGRSETSATGFFFMNPGQHSHEIGPDSGLDFGIRRPKRLFFLTRLT